MAVIVPPTYKLPPTPTPPATVNAPVVVDEAVVVAVIAIFGALNRFVESFQDNGLDTLRGLKSPYTSAIVR